MDCCGKFWRQFVSLLLSWFGRQCRSQDTRCQDQENGQIECNQEVLHSSVLSMQEKKEDAEVTDIRDEPTNDPGLVENVQASCSAPEEELSLRVEISRMCVIECLTEELLLRNDAEIAYLQQTLKKTHDKYSRMLEAENLANEAHSRLMECIEDCNKRIDRLQYNES